MNVPYDLKELADKLKLKDRIVHIHAMDKNSRRTYHYHVLSFHCTTT